jgi:hypothetical protein
LRTKIEIMRSSSALHYAKKSSKRDHSASELYEINLENKERELINSFTPSINIKVQQQYLTRPNLGLNNPTATMDLKQAARNSPRHLGLIEDGD